MKERKGHPLPLADTQTLAMFSEAVIRHRTLRLPGWRDKEKAPGGRRS
jgi:hypothetical protein